MKKKIEFSVNPPGYPTDGCNRSIPEVVKLSPLTV